MKLSDFFKFERLEALIVIVIGTSKELLLIIRNRQLKLWGHIMRKQSLVNSTLTGHMKASEAEGNSK